MRPYHINPKYRRIADIKKARQRVRDLMDTNLLDGPTELVFTGIIAGLGYAIRDEDATEFIKNVLQEIDRLVAYLRENHQQEEKELTANPYIQKAADDLFDAFMQARNDKQH